MTQYIFFLHAAPDAFAGFSPADFQTVKSKYAKWRDQMLAEGCLLSGNKLQDGNGCVIRGGIVTDGPYTESKEVVGGLFVIQAENYEAATALAQTCPHCQYGTLEIRAIEVMN